MEERVNGQEGVAMLGAQCPTGSRAPKWGVDRQRARQWGWRTARQADIGQRAQVLGKTQLELCRGWEAAAQRAGVDSC